MANKRIYTRKAQDRTKARQYKGKSGHSCEVCGWEVPRCVLLTQEAWRKYSGVDCHHVIPVSCGGTDAYENLIVLCPNHHATAHLISRRIGQEYYGPMSKHELHEALLQIDSDPEGWARERDSKNDRSAYEVVTLVGKRINESRKIAREKRKIARNERMIRIYGRAGAQMLGKLDTP